MDSHAALIFPCRISGHNGSCTHPSSFTWTRKKKSMEFKSEDLVGKLISLLCPILLSGTYGSSRWVAVAIVSGGAPSCWKYISRLAQANVVNKRVDHSFQYFCPVPAACQGSTEEVSTNTGAVTDDCPNTETPLFLKLALPHSLWVLYSQVVGIMQAYLGIAWKVRFISNYYLHGNISILLNHI